MKFHRLYKLCHIKFCVLHVRRREETDMGRGRGERWRNKAAVSRMQQCEHLTESSPQAPPPASLRWGLKWEEGRSETPQKREKREWRRTSPLGKQVTSAPFSGVNQTRNNKRGRESVRWKEGGDDGNGEWTILTFLLRGRPWLALRVELIFLRRRGDVGET